MKKNGLLMLLFAILFFPIYVIILLAKKYY